MKKLNIIITAIFVLVGISLQAKQNEQIENLVRTYVSHERFSGSLAVFKNKEFLFHQAFGFSNISEKSINTIETAFDIGSISKQFTATAILQLVHEGRINLDTCINVYLGDYASNQWKTVNVHHLLTHTSGIPSLMRSGQGLDDVWPNEEPIALKDLIDYFQDLPLLFPAGTRYQYSNSGYVLLAAIIEQTSGMSYSQYMEKEIFTKNGLMNTSVGSRATAKTATAQWGYRSDLSKKAVVFPWSWAIGCGGIFSTTGDLVHWFQVIHSENFLTPKLRGLLFVKHAKKRENEYYGYGWEIIQRGADVRIQHGGTTPGFTSLITYEPKSDVLVVALTNQTYEGFMQLGESELILDQFCRNVFKTTEGEEFNLMPARKLIQDSSVLNYSGLFELEDGATLQLENVNENTYCVKSSVPILRYAFEKEIALDSPFSNKVHRIAQCFLSRDFSVMKEFSDEKLSKFLNSPELLGIYDQLTSKVGSFKGVHVYKIENRKGLVRLEGDDATIDFTLLFNENELVIGFWESGFYLPLQMKEWMAFTTEDGALLIDGFPYGEKDVWLRERDGKFVLEQLGRSFLINKR